MNEFFHKIAHRFSEILGSAWAFFFALSIIILWALSGPLFDYSDRWQLFVNTGTTIMTFLLVFLIQNTQNRDSKAIHLKLDELIRALKSARDSMVDLEDLEDHELDKIQKEFELLREKALNVQNKRKSNR
ncbi:MAG TPA: low affinity iron permease family protein [Verrucomicrobiae bacterium]|nr:low affinity iron permease family protein [Verrucomicrobiae bacterium]